jgi:uncharacterized protein (UPF0332 family)
MSFNWEEYLIFADNLLAIIENKSNYPEFVNEETLLRNAISRAYYAAYHCALDYLLNNTVFQRSRYDSHATVIQAYQNSVYRDRKAIVPKLRLMREIRQRADYDDVFQPNSQNQLMNLLESARKATSSARETLRMVRSFAPRTTKEI